MGGEVNWNQKMCPEEKFKKIGLRLKPGMVTWRVPWTTEKIKSSGLIKATIFDYSYFLFEVAGFLYF